MCKQCAGCKWFAVLLRHSAAAYAAIPTGAGQTVCELNLSLRVCSAAAAVSSGYAERNCMSADLACWSHAKQFVRWEPFATFAGEAA